MIGGFRFGLFPAETIERRFGVFERAGLAADMDGAAGVKPPDGVRGLRSPSSPLQIGEATFAIGDEVAQLAALEPKTGMRGLSRISVHFKMGDRLGGFRRQIFAIAIERGSRALLEIGYLRLDLGEAPCHATHFFFVALDLDEPRRMLGYGRPVLEPLC